MFYLLNVSPALLFHLRLSLTTVVFAGLELDMELRLTFKSQQLSFCFILPSAALETCGTLLVTLSLLEPSHGPDRQHQTPELATIIQTFRTRFKTSQCNKQHLWPS